MTDQEILQKLSEIVSDVVKLPSVTLTPETVATDVPGWDSLAHIQIIGTAEVRFNIKFRAAELDGARNVGELVAMIQRKAKR